MNKYIALYLPFLFFFATSVLAQTPNRTPQKIKEDSLAFEKMKKDKPELFLNKRLPIKLTDGNFYVKGYHSLGIRLTNNHLVDSVYHNFHLGSTETGIIPYNNIKVTESVVSIDLFDLGVFSEASKADSAKITLMDTSRLKDGLFDTKYFRRQETPFFFLTKNSDYSYPDTIGIQSLKSFANIEIRISLNGKLLFDWTPLISFSKNIFKSEHKWPPTQYGPFWIIGYSYGFHIADQALAINDQLLVEIKEIKKGWMLDRFNITRVEAQPSITKIITTNKKQSDFLSAVWQNVIAEKKSLRLTQAAK